ncbi:MAG: response regulator [Candidatus Pacebacteria bacterium]|nr:response regulator [Candidatus Paceibacterota bacterium]
MKKILIIDDSEAQRSNAERIAKEMGLEPVVCDPLTRGTDRGLDWMRHIPEVDYVVTDLMWRYRTDEDYYGQKPMGLMVAIHSLYFGKPVAICTNDSDHHRGHHGEAIGFIHDGYLQPTCYFPDFNESAPFGWDDNKNWRSAIEQVIQLAEKQTTTTKSKA